MKIWVVKWFSELTGNELKKIGKINTVILNLLFAFELGEFIGAQHIAYTRTVDVESCFWNVRCQYHCPICVDKFQ